MWRYFAAAIILLVTTQAEPTSVRSRVIFPIPLERLVQTSDVVAQVRIVAVDEEVAYPPLARAKVEESFKGTRKDDVLLIDAWSVSEVGSVFVVFLHDTHEPVRNRLRSAGTTFVVDPEAPYYTLPEGLARQMPVRLTSAFGKLDVAVSFPPEYVPLPPSLRQVKQRPPDRDREILVRQDQLYRVLRANNGV